MTKSVGGVTPTQKAAIKEFLETAKPVVAPRSVMVEYVYYTGIVEEPTWTHIMLRSDVAIARCFPNQLEARKHQEPGFKIWRREIVGKGFGGAELVKE